MASLQERIISYTLIGLFVFCFISFFYLMIQHNNPSSDLLNDPRINKTFSDVNDSLGGLIDKSNTQLSASQNETITAGASDLISYSIIGTARAFISQITLTFNVIANLLLSIFNINPVIFSTIFSIVIMGILFGLWRLYKQGY